VASLALAWPAAAVPVSVGVDFSQLPEDTFDRVDGVSLEQALVVRLVQDGFAVVSLASAPQLVVSIAASPPSLRISVTTGDASRTADVLFEGVDLPELRLETAQRVAELVRAVKSELKPATNADVKVEPPATVAEKEPEEPVVEAPPLRWAVLVGAGGAYRASMLDGAVSLGAELRWPSGPMLRIGGQAVRANEAAIDAVDALAQVGAGWSWLLGPVDVAVSLEAGAHVHVFSVQGDASAGASGVRWDGVVSLPVEVTVGGASGLLVRLRASPFATTLARVHAVGEVEAWSRGALGVALGLHVGWGG